MFNIDKYEKDILSVGYQNKIIHNQDKWNHYNNIQIQSSVGTNHCLPLSHMAKSYIQIKETKEFINEFSIEFIINPTLNIKKAFKEQVTKCMKTVFGAMNQPHISIILSKINKCVSIINVL